MKTVATIALATLLVGAYGAAAAQSPTPMDSSKKMASPSYQTSAYHRTVPDSLVSQARIAEDSARTLALAKVPNGTIEALVLERRRGKLTWTFSIRDTAKSRNTQVFVDALDGSVTSGNQKSSS